LPARQRQCNKKNATKIGGKWFIFDDFVFFLLLKRVSKEGSPFGRAGT
jgi:hypothetical protein